MPDDPTDALDEHLAVAQAVRRLLPRVDEVARAVIAAYESGGRVVAFGHGCGAHSEVRLSRKQVTPPLPEHVFDTVSLDEVELL